jgi:hypothetical protein
LPQIKIERISAPRLQILCGDLRLRIKPHKVAGSPHIGEHTGFVILIYISIATIGGFSPPKIYRSAVY